MEIGADAAAVTAAGAADRVPFVENEDMTAMELTSNDHDGVTVLTMSGDLEVQEIDDFKSVMDEALKKGPSPKIVLDLSGVTRMTSYVVALVGFYNAQIKQAKGRLIIAGPTSAPRRRFELSGLASVIHMAEDTESALEMMKP